MTPSKNILVFGARSDIGSYLLPLLAQSGCSIYAFSRSDSGPTRNSDTTWVRKVDFQKGSMMTGVEIPTVISLMPIWKLADYQDILESIGSANLIAFSSTSILSKEKSSSSRERQIANLLEQGETWIHNEFAKAGGCALIFRPTMIYGGNQNENVNRIKRIIKRTRFFVLPGRGTGLRQPVHAEDLATLCCQCLEFWQQGIRTVCLAGGETLQYRTMIERIFLSSGIQPKIISLPNGVLGFSARIIGFLPIFKDLTTEMLVRVNRDLCYDHQEAIDIFGWSPRTFQP